VDAPHIRAVHTSSLLSGDFTAAVSSVSALDRTRIEVVRSSSLNPVDGMKRNVERLDSIQTSFQEAVEVTSGETHSTELR